MRVRLETLGYVDTDRVENEARSAQQTERTSAFERLFARQFPALKRYLTRFVCAEDAEELAQEAFVRVYAGDATRIDSPRGFLFQTARNLAISHIRHCRVTATALAKDIGAAPATGNAPSIEEMLSRFQDLACVRAAIECLPPRRREIFLMRMKNDLSYTEIADKAGISLKGVESHLARGVEACRDFFEQCARTGCSGKCKQGGMK
jgi:RNA polymerase sigma-70 factor (ECF subfamily)